MTDFLSTATHTGCDECIQAVFASLVERRRSLHRRAGQHGCPTRSPGSGWSAACEACGCADLVHEVLADVAHAVARRQGDTQAAPVANHHGYLWQAARAAAVERDRKANTRRGAPAKPTTTTGVPGRVIAALRAEGQVWLVAAFGVLRAAAAHGAGSWPWQELAVEKTSVLGPQADTSRPALAADLQRLREVVVAVKDQAWLYENITAPLSAGAVTSLDVDEDTDPARRRQIERALAVDPQWEADEDALFEAYCDQRDLGLAPPGALQAAAAAVLGVCAQELARARRVAAQVLAEYEEARAARGQRRAG